MISATATRERKPVMEFRQTLICFRCRYDDPPRRWYSSWFHRHFYCPTRERQRLMHTYAHTVY